MYVRLWFLWCIKHLYVTIFSNYVLRLTDGLEDIGGIRWQLALCLGLAWAIIFLVLLKGIESLGKVYLSYLSINLFFI